MAKTLAFRVQMMFIRFLGKKFIVSMVTEVYFRAVIHFELVFSSFRTDIMIALLHCTRNTILCY